MRRTTEELITHIAPRVVARKPVKLSAESAGALQADAVRRRAQTWEEELLFEVAVCDKRDHVVEVIARVSNLTVARATFRAAVIQRPGKHVMLKQKASVLAEFGRVDGTRVANGVTLAEIGACRPHAAREV